MVLGANENTMKTHFDLDNGGDKKRKGQIKIIGVYPKYKPYVSVEINGVDMWIKDKDLERFAVNILKAIRSKKLNAPKT